MAKSLLPQMPTGGSGVIGVNPFVVVILLAVEPISKPCTGVDRSAIGSGDIRKSCCMEKKAAFVDLFEHGLIGECIDKGVHKIYVTLMSLRDG